MTELDERLRAALHGVADATAPPSLPSGPSYRSVARRRQVMWSTAVAAAAAVILLVVGAVTVVMHRPDGVPPAAGGPAAWPTRGSLAGDTTLLIDAIRTWDAAPVPAGELPHRDVHALFAERSVAGVTVVLYGRDARGKARIAWLNTDATSHTVFRHRLHLVADKLVTDAKPGLIGFYGVRPTPRPSTDHLVIAIAPPGTTSLQWRSEVGHWRPVPSRDGAGLAVYATQVHMNNVSVRAGGHGSGTRVLDEEIALDFGQIDHDADPSQQPPADAACHDGVCSASASAVGGVMGGLKSGGGWSDLRDARAMSPTEHDWGEFSAEALLMAQDRASTASGFGYSEAWAGVLPEGVGVYLLRFNAGKSPEHLVFYVDRPTWFGGRLGADVTVGSAPVPAIVTLVPSTRGADLVAVVADGLRVQWRVNNGRWQDSTAHGNAAFAHLGTVAPGSITYRVVDGNGRTVASGRPSTTALG